MKYGIIVAFLAVAVLVAGCGKSDMQKKLEADLYAEVNTLHDAGMSTYKQAQDLAGQIDGAIANHNAMAAKYVKQFAGHSADDLTAAKEKLATVIGSMDSWMKEFKPYDPEAPHEQVLTALGKNKEELTSMNTQLAEAVKSAMGALDAHKMFAETALKGIVKK